MYCKTTPIPAHTTAPRFSFNLYPCHSVSLFIFSIFEVSFFLSPCHCFLFLTRHFLSFSFYLSLLSLFASFSLFLSLYIYFFNSLSVFLSHSHSLPLESFPGMEASLTTIFRCKTKSGGCNNGLPTNLLDTTNTLNFKPHPSEKSSTFWK